jgi:hypothetical protein
MMNPKLALRAYLTRLPLLAWALFLLCAAPAWADGNITHLSGQVSVQKADGKSLPGVAGAKVVPGDTVVTGAAGFVRIEMSDGGEMVLRPNSQLRIDSYKFAEGAPAEDNLAFSMLKGGMRTITGLIGKRGNRDAYKLQTATTTIGIRGTQFDLRVCLGDCGALPDGTYLSVFLGAIEASNLQGNLAVLAGQVAHVAPSRPPVLLPRNPGIGFTPPAQIPKLDDRKKQAPAAAAPPTAPAATAAKPGAAAPDKAGAVDAASDATKKPTAAPTSQEADCSVQ